MKKSIIALAAVAAMAAQADQTTLYGRLSVAYSYNDNGQGASTSGFADNGSRFGIKGESDAGNGLTAFYKYENRFGGAYAATKRAYVGLKGGFGAVSLGNQTLPTDTVGEYHDPFNALTPDAGFRGKTDSKRSIVYMSPDMGGFQAGVGLEMDGMASEVDTKGGATHGNKKKSNHVDYINVAATYNANGIHAGLGYETSNGYTTNNGKDDADMDIITAAAGYGNDMFEVGAKAEFFEQGDDDAVVARLSGLYKVTPMDSIYLGLSSKFDDSDDDGFVGSVGFQHKFSKRTRTWAEYSFQDDGNDDSNNTLNIGLRTDF